MSKPSILGTCADCGRRITDIAWRSSWQVIHGQRVTIVGDDEVVCSPCKGLRMTAVRAKTLQQLDAQRCIEVHL